MSQKNKFILSKIIIITSICIVISISCLLISINVICDKYNNMSYGGITICGVDVSHMNKEEIESVIDNDIIPDILDKKINIECDGNIISYAVNEYDGEFLKEETADKVINYGKDKNFINKFFLIKSKNLKDFNIQYKCSEDELNKLTKQIKEDINITPKNATITKCETGFCVSDSAFGRSIDEEDLSLKIDDALCYNIDETISVKTKEVAPDIDSDSLKKIKGILGSFQTDYSSSSFARSNNIQVVTKQINGTFLMPGEVFSYGEHAKKGQGKYMDAPGYVEGKVVNVEGGGICQPCTTLYRAVMKSNIRSIERHPHMYTVSYTKPGLDATVGNWGTLDYKFKNTYDFPIYIEVIAQNGIVKFNIYGDSSALNGYTYDIDSEVYGLSASSYFITYDSTGKIVNRELIAKDTYSSH